jgi:hypothetical protein
MNTLKDNMSQVTDSRVPKTRQSEVEQEGRRTQPLSRTIQALRPDGLALSWLVRPLRPNSTLLLESVAAQVQYHGRSSL